MIVSYEQLRARKEFGPWSPPILNPSRAMFAMQLLLLPSNVQYPLTGRPCLRSLSWCSWLVEIRVDDHLYISQSGAWRTTNMWHTDRIMMLLSKAVDISRIRSDSNSSHARSFGNDASCCRSALLFSIIIRLSAQTDTLDTQHQRFEGSADLDQACAWRAISREEKDLSGIGQFDMTRPRESISHQSTICQRPSITLVHLMWRDDAAYMDQLTCYVIKQHQIPACGQTELPTCNHINLGNRTRVKRISPLLLSNAEYYEL